MAFSSFKLSDEQLKAVGMRGVAGTTIIGQAERVKSLIDGTGILAAAEGLNKLLDALDNTAAAESLGAKPLFAEDKSASNVFAKLSKLRSLLLELETALRALIAATDSRLSESITATDSRLSADIAAADSKWLAMLQATNQAVADLVLDPRILPYGSITADKLAPNLALDGGGWGDDGAALDSYNPYDFSVFGYGLDAMRKQKRVATRTAD